MSALVRGAAGAVVVLVVGLILMTAEVLMGLATTDTAMRLPGPRRACRAHASAACAV